MTEKSVPPVPQGLLTQEQIESISGGTCTPQEILGVLNQLKSGYETLIDFTSYVIERVAK